MSDVSVRIEGIARWKEKILKRLPAALRDQIKAANTKNADEFIKLVATNIPRGDPEDGNLVDTLHKGDATGNRRSETGVVVTIGGPDQPHPVHLEAGHRNKDGTHVPGKPYWWPARRVLRKRAKSRVARAANAAVRSLTTT